MNYRINKLIFAVTLCMMLPAYAQEKDQTTFQQCTTFLKNHWGRITSFTLPALLSYYYFSTKPLEHARADAQHIIDYYAKFQQRWPLLSQFGDHRALIRAQTVTTIKDDVALRNYIQREAIVIALTLGTLAWGLYESYKNYQEKMKSYDKLCLTPPVPMYLYDGRPAKTATYSAATSCDE